MLLLRLKKTKKWDLNPDSFNSWHPHLQATSCQRGSCGEKNLLILHKMTLETVELPSYSEEIVNLFSRLSNTVEAVSAVSLVNSPDGRLNILTWRLICESHPAIYGRSLPLS